MTVRMRQDARAGRRFLLCLPTYDERENLAARWSRRSRRVRERTRDAGDVLVIDDSSPDGTGALADELAADAAVAARAAPAAQGGARARLPRRLPLGARARLRLRARDGLRLLARSRGRAVAARGGARRRRPRARLALLRGRRRRELGPRAPRDLAPAAASTRARSSAWACATSPAASSASGAPCSRRIDARRRRRAGLHVPDRDDVPRDAARVPRSWRCRSRSPIAWPAARRCRAGSCSRRCAGCRSCGSRPLRGRSAPKRSASVARGDC